MNYGTRNLLYCNNDLGSGGNAHSKRLQKWAQMEILQKARYQKQHTMNDTVKKIIADKFAEAIENEGLTKTEAARLMGFTPDYVSKLLNDDYRKHLSDPCMEKFRDWSNSGETIIVFSEKNNLAITKSEKSKPLYMEPHIQESITGALARAMVDEKLTSPDVVRLMGLKSKHYVAMILSGKPDQWGRVGKSIWELLHGWSESGMTITEHSKEFYLEKALVNGGIVKDQPEKVLTKDELDKIEPEKPFATGGKLQGHHASHMIIDEATIKLGDGPLIDWESIEKDDQYRNRIKKLFDEWGADLKQAETILSTEEETIPSDRFEVILQVINELKELGFDIHISPKS